MCTLSDLSKRIRGPQKSGKKGPLRRDEINICPAADSDILNKPLNHLDQYDDYESEENLNEFETLQFLANTLAPPPTQLFQEKDHREKNTKKILVINNLEILQSSLDTLDPENWLDGEVIDAYIHLMTKAVSNKVVKVLHLSTIFFQKLVGCGPKGESVLREGIDRDVLNQDVLIAPIFHQNHWTLIIIDIVRRIIISLDSLNLATTFGIREYSAFLSNLSMTHKKRPINWSLWRLYKPTDMPRQTNSFDCGIYICTYAKMLCTGKGRLRSGNLNFERRSIRESIVCSTESTVIESESKTKNIDICEGDICENVISNTIPSGFRSTENYLLTSLNTIFSKDFSKCNSIPCLKPKNKNTIKCGNINYCRKWYHVACDNPKMEEEDYSKLEYECNNCIA